MRGIDNQALTKLLNLDNICNLTISCINLLHTYNISYMYMYIKQIFFTGYMCTIYWLETAARHLPKLNEHKI